MATDDFNRANNNFLGANWIEIEDATDPDKTRAFEIDTNRLTVRSTRGLSIHTWGYAGWATDLGGHHSSELEFADFVANDVVDNGPAVRCDVTGTANLATLYGAFYKANSAQPRLQLRKYVAQSLQNTDGTIIGTATLSLVLGDKLKIVANGSQIQVLKNGVEVLLVTDTDIPAGGRPGFAVKDNATAGTNTITFWENWVGLAVAAGGGGGLPRTHRIGIGINL